MGPPRATRAAGGAASVLTAAAAASTVYALAVRPWHLRWGATEAELRRSLPGDELVGHPMTAATRALTIEAPPADVWPWLAQQGYGRAGWYAFRLDNAWRPSPWRIVPELQEIRVGDLLRTNESDGFEVAAFEEDRFLLLRIGQARADH